MPISIGPGSLSKYSSVYHLREMDSCMRGLSVSSRRTLGIVELLKAMPQAMMLRHEEMSQKLCDAHVHTTRSDGRLSPQQLFLTAAKEGVGTIVLTDHFDTGEPIEDIRLASNSGLDYNFGGIEFRSLNPEDPQYHFKAFFNPFDEDIVRYIGDMFKWNNGIMPFPMLLVIKNMDTSGLLSMMPDKFFETLDANGINRQKAADVVNKLAVKLKRDPNPIDRARERYTRKAPFHEAVDRAYFTGFWQDIYGIRRRTIIRELFRFLPPEVFGHLVSYPKITDILRELSEKGCWISLAHPDCYERIGITRDATTQLINDLAGLGLLNGVETTSVSVPGGSYDQYSRIAKDLDLCEDGGSDFHAPMAQSLGKTANGRNATEYLLFDTVREYLSLPVLEKAETLYEEGNYREALRSLRQAMVINPYNTDIYEYAIMTLNKI